MEVKGWQDELLKVMVLQAIALHARGDKDQAVQVLGDALALVTSLFGTTLLFRRRRAKRVSRTTSSRAATSS